MEITQTPAPVPRPPAPADTASAVSSDFETFLRLMTTQIRNQDPLDPMKAEEFSVQLATFSGVEQQVRTNQLLESLVGSGGADGFAAISGWLGHDVLATGPARYDGTPLTLRLPPALAGDRHELVVTDAAGVEIDRRSVTGAGATLDWPADGRMAMGQYTFTLDSYEAGRVVVSEPVASYARVDEIRQTVDGPVLVLPGGVEIVPDDVLALRRA
ncbi:flagellar basal body rod modification protein [Palleronia sediminis]|uniref:Basal-body rod modification protein FlgD n=1 Tax=Palleronia sediminis TaxID=2547833 RepID=A0A4R6AJE3_9RHOB|nr:flagellar hook capping FlgD N-terminal domain-containing protein [Palleronia sediminis]TDL81533.1 flagellar basal body rod modification protein [Palleronia sediminis]